MSDRWSFKVCNNWNSLHNDIENIKTNLIKNTYPPFLIDKVIKKFLRYKFSSNQNQLKDKSDVQYYKLAYSGNLPHHIKNKLLKLCKEFHKENFNNNLVFNSFKIKNHFSYKDPVPNGLKSFLVYKFTCASCSSSHIGETCHHFKTRITEQIKKDNKSHICKHLHSTATCFDSHNSLKCTTKSLALTLSLKLLLSLALFCLCLCSCCFLRFSFLYFFHCL